MSGPLEKYSSTDGMTMTRNALEANPRLPVQVIMIDELLGKGHTLRTTRVLGVDALPRRTTRTRRT
eukprot:1211368-Alexandrium_andersonii.AAC.1